VTENYFNYFTEIEEHFRRARGTGLFLLSPLDWALIEAWKNSGVPLEAVLRGIDAAFEKWRKRPPRARAQQVNSLAYCAQAVAAQAQSMADGGAIQPKQVPAPFPVDDLRAYLERNAASLRAAGHPDLADSLESLNTEEHLQDLERLEQRLSALEEKMIARVRASAGDLELFEARQALDRELKPYRGKMTAGQLAMLERQFLDRRLLESAGLPRLSLFYLGL
jgi:flagellar motility protein MotE (MotC chaperone)